jgi:D-glycero-alpha-D-manno-heptose-7-phosphate kinase
VIISKTPFRISFFGGGTDYPAYFRTHGGAVLSTTIDKYCWISVRYLPPFFGVKHRVVWSHIETVQSISEILHPCVRAALVSLGFDDTRGLEIRHTGDLPARAGMGSSSSFAVGLYRALLTLQGHDCGAMVLAGMAIHLEQNVMGEHVGCQDQVAAAHGGFNLIEFCTDGAVRIAPVKAQGRTLTELNKRLMLFYTGTTRIASNVAKSVIEHMDKRQDALYKMWRLVEEGAAALTAGDLDKFGVLLNQNWLLKRELSPLVSNEQIDGVYQRAIDAGALGGKLLGAGAGGFMIFYVPLDKQETVKAELSDLLYVPFKFEREGCTIAYRG